jgi:integrase
MANLKFYIRVKKGIENKKVNVRIRLYNGKLYDCTAITRMLIQSQFWSNKKGEINVSSDFPESVEFNQKLTNLRLHIESLENKLVNKASINTQWLNTAINTFYNPEANDDPQKDLLSFIKKFIIDSRSRINPITGQLITRSTLLKYGTCFNYLKDFSKVYYRPVDFESIDSDFYNDFVSFLCKRIKKIKLKNGQIKTEKGLATNTVGKQIAVLKNFIIAAIEQGYTNIPMHKIKRFKIVTEDSENIYLTEQELSDLNELDLSYSSKLESVRDLFLVAAWTGCRFSDIGQVNSNNILDGFIRFKQVKTNNLVIIPIHPIVKAIMEKYNNCLPRVFTNQKMNEYLKVIGDLAELNDTFQKSITIGGVKQVKTFQKKELLSTHTARRSFATNLYKSDFPSISIMQITGHKTEKAFLKYIKVTPQEHANKLKDFWKSK